MKCKCSGNRIFIWYFLWLVKTMFLAPWKLGGYQHHLLFLNGALLLIIAANTVHVWNYQERILAGNFASIVGKTRNTSVFFFRLALLFFASGHASTVFFAFCCENLTYQMDEGPSIYYAIQILGPEGIPLPTSQIS